MGQSGDVSAKELKCISISSTALIAIWRCPTWWQGHPVVVLIQAHRGLSWAYLASCCSVEMQGATQRALLPFVVSRIANDKAVCSTMEVSVIYNLQEESRCWWSWLSHVSRPHGWLLSCLVKSERRVQCRIAPFTADSFSICKVLSFPSVMGFFSSNSANLFSQESRTYEVS